MLMLGVTLLATNSALSGEMAARAAITRRLQAIFPRMPRNLDFDLHPTLLEGMFSRGKR
jgi:hypothetical protein